MAGTKEDPFLDTIAVCDICLDLDRNHLRRQWRRFGRLPAMDVPYKFTLSKLAESAESKGCKGCAALNASALRIGSENEIDFKNACLEFLNEGGLEGLSLTLATLYPVLAGEKDWQKAKDAEELQTHFMIGPGLLIEFVTGPTKKSPDRIREFRISSPRYEIFLPEDDTFIGEKQESAILTRPSRCGDTGSDNAVAWAQAQLEKCLSTHIECNVHDPDDWKLPTRVLDLGENLSLLTADPRIYVTNGSEKAEYVCLSHCWGPPDKKPLETTPSTLEAFQQRIPWDQLNATFREATIFTRKLGVRYLWIDSLCIVQGDAQDWAREAKRMAGVYENALLTLAAASSANGHEGLFRKVKREVSIIDEKKEEDKSSEKVAIRLLPDPAFFAYDRTSGFHHPYRVSPLLKRAWVFQERALSRRMLYFTPLELVLECRCGCASESGQPYWSETPLKHRFRAAYKTELDYKAKVAEKSEDDSEGDDKQEDDNLSLLWRALVEDFTHLGLTRTSDTLPAMTGLAQRILRARNFGFNPDEEHKATYLAGLWRPTLLDDMLWERVRRSPGGQVNASVPSWSWARSDSSKKFARHSPLAYLCGVFDAWCDPLLESRFLGVGEQGGQVTLEGFLIPARYKKPWLVIDENPRVSYNVKEDYDWDSGEEIFSFDAGFNEREKEEKLNPDVIPDGERLFVLPVILTPDESGAGGYGADVHALVLRPCADGTDLRRVGIFQTSLLHMRHHDYILEGNDLFQRELKRHIAYGESILGEDGLCHQPKDTPDSPAKGEGTMAFKEHRDVAHHTYTVMAGRKGAPSDGFRLYHGLKHQEVLKSQLNEEQERLSEWQRRDETGDAQKHPRVTVIIT